MHGIHFHKGRQSQLLEIGIGSVLENTAVRDLCFVYHAWLELHFTFQVNVSCGQDPHVEIGVNATHRQLQFRMVRNDLVRRLSLLDQRTDDPVFLAKFLSGHADTGAGLLKAFPIFAVSKPGIVRILMSNGAMANFLWTAIANVRSPVEPQTVFFLKVFAGLVTVRTGRAFDTAHDQFLASLVLWQ